MRYVVVGTSGAGKSTFARALSARTQATYVELDDLHWSANWTPRSPADFASSVREATQGTSWVVDGNYSPVRLIVWTKATHIIWLNFSRLVVFPRIIRRTLRRAVVREELWHGNYETLAKSFLSKDSILLWSFTTYAKNARKYAALRAGVEYGHLEWVELTTPAQAQEYLRRCA